MLKLTRKISPYHGNESEENEVKSFAKKVTSSAAYFVNRALSIWELMNRAQY